MLREGKLRWFVNAMRLPHNVHFEFAKKCFFVFISSLHFCWLWHPIWIYLQQMQLKLIKIYLFNVHICGVFFIYFVQIRWKGSSFSFRHDIIFNPYTYISLCNIAHYHHLHHQHHLHHLQFGQNKTDGGILVRSRVKWIKKESINNRKNLLHTIT